VGNRLMLCNMGLIPGRLRLGMELGSRVRDSRNETG